MAYGENYKIDWERQPVYNPQFYARVMAKRAATERAAERARVIAKAQEKRRLAEEAEAAYVKTRESALLRVNAEVAAAIASLPIGQFERVMRRACRVFQVSPAQLKGKRKYDALVIARQFICYWACRLTGMSLPLIGRKLNRDHTSILHGARAYPAKRAKQGRTLRKAR